MPDTIVYITCPDNDRLENIAEKIDSDHIEIVMFSGADQAVETAIKSPPTAMIVDFVTDSIVAFGACEKIRQSTVLASIPLLAITDVEDLPTMQDMYQEGVDDFVIEPFANCELLARLKHTILKASAQSQNSGVNDIAKKISKQLDDFELISKIDRVKTELQGNADSMIDIHEQLRQSLEQASEGVAKAEYALQFTDRVAQQVNEIGKLIYGIHIGIKRGQRPYTDKEGDTLEKSSSKSVLEKQDKEGVDDLLKSLDL